MIDFDDTDYFEEDAISEEQAWNACERFVAMKTEVGIIFMLFEGQVSDGLISKDKVLYRLGRHLEAGFMVRA